MTHHGELIRKIPRASRIQCSCDLSRPGTYVIRTPDGAYIGRSVNVSARWSGHRTLLRKGSHHSALLQRAYDKHGEGSLRIERVTPDPADEEMVMREWRGPILNADTMDAKERRERMFLSFLPAVPTEMLRAELARRGP